MNVKYLAAAAILLSAALTAIAQQGSVRVTVARANVRQTPSDRGAVVSQIPYGTVLDLGGVEGDWFRVYVPMGALRVEAYLSKKVAVLVPPSGGTAAPEATPAAPAGKLVPGISVAVDAAGKTTWLTAMAARAVPIVERHKTLAALAGSTAIGDAAGGRAVLPEDPSVEITWVWLIDRGQLTVTLDDAHPSFFATFRDAPGVNVNELIPTVVKLVPAGDKWAVVAMARGRADAAARGEADWTIARDLQQDAVKVGIVGGATGAMTVRLPAALAPGDYALVLRPAVLRKYAGRDVLGDEGIGSVMGVVWAFRIRPKA